MLYENPRNLKPPWYILSEVSEKYTVPQNVLARRCRIGEIKSCKIGNRWFIDTSDNLLEEKLKTIVKRSPRASWAGSSCKSEGCELAAQRIGYCNGHYTRYKKYGETFPDRPLQIKSDAGYIQEDGYRVVPAYGHPNGNKAGSIMEHIKVMSEVIGRPLIKGETVHHKNGIRSDNNPSNLELWSSNHPSGQKIKDLVEWANGVITLYGSDPEAW